MEPPQSLVRSRGAARIYLPNLPPDENILIEMKEPFWVSIETRNSVVEDGGRGILLRAPCTAQQDLRTF